MGSAINNDNLAHLIAAGMALLWTRSLLQGLTSGRALRMGTLCGLWFLNRGVINPTSRAHQCIHVLLGVPILSVFVLVAEIQFTELVGEVMENSLLVLLLPPSSA